MEYILEYHCGSVSIQSKFLGEGVRGGFRPLGQCHAAPAVKHGKVRHERGSPDMIKESSRLVSVPA